MMQELDTRKVVAGTVGLFLSYATYECAREFRRGQVEVQESNLAEEIWEIENEVTCYLEEKGFSTGSALQSLPEVTTTCIKDRGELFYQLGRNYELGKNAHIPGQYIQELHKLGENIDVATD